MYSTPAYRPTLDLYGWGDLGDELRALVRGGRLDELAAAVPDELLDALVPTAPYGELAAVLLERFGPFADGIVLAMPAAAPDEAALAATVAELRAGGAGVS